MLTAGLALLSARVIQTQSGANLQMPWFFLANVLRNFRFGIVPRRVQLGALDMPIRDCVREGRRVMGAHLRDRFKSGGQFDQRRFAKGCPEKADSKRRTKDDSRWDLNDRVTGRRGQPGGAKDKAIAIDQIG